MDGIINIGLLGVDGAMGRIISRLAIQDPEINVLAGFTKPDSENIGKDIGSLSGTKKIDVPVESVIRLDEVLEEKKPEVMIDFTVAPATEKNAPAIVKKGIKMVIGTTGLSMAFLNDFEKLVEKNDAPSIIASNMAVGMNLFMSAVEMVARALIGWDAEIIEAHHHRKRDSPSGTAISLANIIANTWNKNLDDIAKFGRPKGPNPRKIGEQEIGIHSVRAGDIVGDHVVLFAGPGERIELVHRAHDRKCFASGAIAATKFLAKNKLKPKIYGMKDVIKQS
ncbi:MAG: 4-hydroxy-tetrahydrodipicolinate reductase [Promethearchaeota archaeon]